MSTTARALHLLSLLQAHRFWTGADLAERLEVSLRTLRRDVDQLRELGYPVTARPGVDGGYELAAGAVLPPLVLDDEEAVALAVGLQAATQGSVAGMAEAAVQALAKVVQVMPAALRDRVEALRAMTEPASWGAVRDPIDPRVLTTLAQACRDAERVTFGYTPAGRERAERAVEPFRLVSLGRRWYLVAYDLDRHDWRSFRLDRLDAPQRTGARFRPRDLPAQDAAAFVRAGVSRQAGEQMTVTAVVQAPAEEVRARIGSWSQVEARSDGSCLVTMTADVLDWPAMALGSVGAEFSVLGPPAFAAFLDQWSGRFARAVAGLTPRTEP